MERITVTEAARMLGISPQAVRVQMQRGILPIGKVFEGITGEKSMYLIYRERVERFMNGEEK